MFLRKKHRMTGLILESQRAEVPMWDRTFLIQCRSETTRRYPPRHSLGTRAVPREAAWLACCYWIEVWGQLGTRIPRKSGSFLEPRRRPSSTTSRTPNPLLITACMRGGRRAWKPFSFTSYDLIWASTWKKWKEWGFSMGQLMRHRWGVEINKCPHGPEARHESLQESSVTSRKHAARFVAYFDCGCVSMRYSNDPTVEYHYYAIQDPSPKCILPSSK